MPPIHRLTLSLSFSLVGAIVLGPAVGCSDSSNAGAADAGPGVTSPSGDASVDATPGSEAGTDASTPCISGAPERQTDAHNCGSCRHDCEGGSCSAGACNPYTLVTTSNIEGVVIGLTVVGAQVYFTTNQQLGGTIQSVSTKGGTPAVLDATFFNAGGITSDGTTLFIGGQGGVYQRPLAGGSTTKLADAGNVAGVALDGANLYFASGGVKKVAKSGGVAADVAVAAPGADGLAFGQGLLYIVDAGAYTVVIYDTAGVAATKTLNNDLAFVHDVAIVGAELWYGRQDLDGNGGVYARPADGTGTKRTIVPKTNASALFVTSDAVYFSVLHEVRKVVR